MLILGDLDRHPIYIRCAVDAAGRLRTDLGRPRLQPVTVDVACFSDWLPKRPAVPLLE